MRGERRERIQTPSSSPGAAAKTWFHGGFGPVLVPTGLDQELSRAMLTDHLLSPTHWAGATCTCSPPLPERQEKNIGLQLQGKDGNERTRKTWAPTTSRVPSCFSGRGSISLVEGKQLKARFLARLKPKSLWSHREQWGSRLTSASRLKTNVKIPGEISSRG